MNKKHTFSLPKSTLKNELVCIDLPASKSIANRALIINALSPRQAKLDNISVANDTRLMENLIHNNDTEINAEDAGTTMRFLTAYYAIKNEAKILTGTARMQKRPIGILVNALRELGCSIDYLKSDGYPPLRINSFKSQKSKILSVDANISSQYISALMMIGPCLPEGLTLNLSGKIGSKPYIEMTMKVMQTFGANLIFNDNIIQIKGGGYKGTNHYKIEPDWSAASYWYGLVATQKNGKILLKDLPQNSIQGDHVIYTIMKNMGVNSEFTTEGTLLSYSEPDQNIVEYDYSDCPDLAQTVAAAGGALGIKVKMSGLESLRIKETDRIKALQTELKKFNIQFTELNNQWIIEPTQPTWPESKVEIETYEDHRMAMAFMPLCSFCNLEFINPNVVRKSYPHFWNDVENSLTSN